MGTVLKSRRLGELFRQRVQVPDAGAVNGCGDFPEKIRGCDIIWQSRATADRRCEKMRRPRLV
jgi:hypothetical protein